MKARTFSRRAFMAGLGGITVAFSLAPRMAWAQQPARLPGSLQDNRLLDAWIRINADGSATVFTGKVELGQGAVTALAQIAAEELDLPLGRVTMVSGDTARTPDEGFTSGSLSIESSGTALRLAGAEVRAILIGLAAERLGVPAEGLSVSDGVISAPDGRKLGYGEIAAAADLHREASAKAAPKSPAAFQVVGKPVPRRDIPAKVTGGVAYVQDLRLPGMLHGRIVRPPRYGAQLEDFGVADDVIARDLGRGVVAVVRDGSFLGVITEREEQAVEARKRLLEKTRWSGGNPLPDPAKLPQVLMSLPSKEMVVSAKQAPRAAGGSTHEATYTRPYVMHGSIGPSCAVAEFNDGKLTVWTHSQGVFPLRRDLAKVLKLDLTAIRCTHMEGSGCYGHNAADDVALDAALLARAMPGRPVRVQWMRDDEHGWEPFGPAMVMRAKAALGADGRIVDWNYELWSNSHSTRPGEPQGANLLAAWYLSQPYPMSPPLVIPQPAGGGDRNAVPLYDFPSQRIVQHFIPDMPVRVSALRTLGGYANVFAIESFMDELAAAAAADPVAFRLAHLTDPRAKAVIEAVVHKAQWKESDEKGTGTRGRGIAFAKYKNLASYVAVVAEVEVDRANGAVTVPRVYAAADAGQIINPDGLANQIEGGIIQSTSWTLHEAVRFDASGILSRDWQSYPILTMPEVPKVEVELIGRPNEKPRGSGEASQGPAAAAIANAFANATGKRLRDLPLTPDRVKAALA
ncbi:MAG: molybdopterin cofactor-binding domain-containing protein [Xanthobacteraceae bacterium]